MSIIKPKEEEQTTEIKARIRNSIHHEIKAYMDEFKIAKLEDFIEQAASFVLKKDKDWRKRKSSKAA